MTKCKRKLLKIGIFCLMPLFALLFCLSNSYAWYVDENNNMASSNLFDYNSAQTFGNDLSYSNGVLSGNDTRIHFVFMLQTIDINNNITNLYSVNVYSSGVQYYSFNKTSNIKAILFGHNGSANDIKLQYDVTNLDNGSYTLSINILSVSNPQSFDNIMLNAGSTYIEYEPFGFAYINPQNIDFMEYLLGTNYFAHGRVIAYQTNDNNYWNRRVYPNANIVNSSQIAEDTINQYINGNVLNLGILSAQLLSDLSTKSGYNTSNFTAIALKPALAINGTATYPPVECRYIDLYIYCPNVLTTASCLVGGSGDIDYSNHRRVVFTKEGDYIHISFDENSYDYIWDIDIKLTYSSGWVYPQSVRCDLENAPIYSTYDLGVESGYQKGLVEGKQFGYNQGKIDGYNSGYERGKQAGYNEGINSNLETNGFKTLLNSIISYPINLVKNSLDFNFMGINVAQIVMFIISLGIVAFVIQKFKE